MEIWRVKYENDVHTSEDGESFWQWWEVTDGDRAFKASKEQDAMWLCHLLNNREKNDDILHPQA